MGVAAPSVAKLILAVVGFVGAAIQIMGLIGVVAVSIPLILRSSTLTSTREQLTGTSRRVQIIHPPPLFRYARGILRLSSMDHHLSHQEQASNVEMPVRLLHPDQYRG